MTPDEERLAQIREFSADEWRTPQYDVRWVLAKLEESERARTEAEAKAKEAERGWNVCAREARALQGQEARADDAETALAEERAKRETAEVERDAVRAYQKAEHTTYEAAKRLTRDDKKCALLRLLEQRVSGQRCTLRELQRRYDAFLHGDLSTIAVTGRDDRAARKRADENLEWARSKWAEAAKRAETAEARVAELQAMLNSAKATELQLDARIRELTTERDAARNRKHRSPTVAECQNKLDCGGHCVQGAGHNGACLCAGDVDGEPGTCPA